MSKVSDMLNSIPVDLLAPPNNDAANCMLSRRNYAGMSDQYIQSRQPIKHGEEIVEHPDHYKSRVSKERMDAIIKRINERGYLEAIDVIDAWGLNFNLGSASKYILRLSLKDSEITELEKAIEYLKFEIEMRKADIAK